MFWDGKCICAPTTANNVRLEVKGDRISLDIQIGPKIGTLTEENVSFHWIRDLRLDP